MNICILIPAYNEAKTIGKIISELKRKGFNVLVIDDGSEDSTGQIASQAGAMLISHGINFGKGASMKEGFKYILIKTDYEAVIVMDGDGQHKVSDIDKFLEKAGNEEDDIIIGNRMRHTKNMPLVRMLTNKFMSSLLSIICKQRIPDTQCGFRFLKRRVIEAIKLTSSKYETESEMLINASRKGFKIASVPIKTIYRGERSDIHPIRDTLRFVALVIRAYLHKD